MSIFEKVSQLIENKGFTPFNDGDVTPQTTLRDDLCMDSLDIVELSMEIETEYNIRFDDGFYDEVTTIQDVVTYISDRVQ